MLEVIKTEDGQWRNLEDMTTDEKLDEMLALQRALADAIEAITSNPTVGNMLQMYLGQ